MLGFRGEVPWLRFQPDDPRTDTQIGSDIRSSLPPYLLGVGSLDHAWDADADVGRLIGPALGGANPFDLHSGRDGLANPFVSDRGLLLPRSAPLLVPDMAAPGLLGLGLRGLVGESLPSIDSLGRDGSSSAPPTGVSSDHPMFPESVAPPDSSSVREPASFSQLSEDQLREPPDRITETDDSSRSKPASAFGQPDFSPRFTPVDAAVGYGFPEVSETFDPRFIVPVGMPPRPVGLRPRPVGVPSRPVELPRPEEPLLVPRDLPMPLVSPRPPRGIGDNGGPRLNPAPPSRPAIPSQSTPDAPPPRRPAGTEPPARTVRPIAPVEQRSDLRRPAHPLPRTAEAWSMIAKALNEEAPGGQYEEQDGKDTAVGVRLHPDLPDPAAGWDYDPIHPHLRNGYRGEMELVNRIKRALKDEFVVHYGMAAGLRGPDVLTASPDGDVTIWDSKWRGRTTSIGESLAGHQKPMSLKAALRFAEQQLMEAIGSGRLPEPAASKALANVRNGNVFINTIGTGSAHGGVVRCVRNNEYVDCWSK